MTTTTTTTTTTVLGPHSLSSHHASMASSCFLPWPATRSRYTNASSGIIPISSSSSSSSSTYDEALQQDAAMFGKRFLLASSAAVSLAVSSVSAQASPLHIPETFSSHVSHYNAIGNIRSIAPARCLLADRSRGGGGEEDTIFNDVSDAPPLNDSSGCSNNRRSSESSSRPEIVTNESIIEEAWRIVNERFLDARHNTWSQDNWLKKKEEVLKRPVSTRMAAYSTIRSMLSALNDPYSRFITPLELKQLSKYDMTGVGLSLGDGGKDNSDFLRVVGVVLGSPAQVGGIKQGDELLSVNGVSIHGKSAFEASSLIQGPKGTLVTITVRHNPCADIQTLSLERQQSVKTPVYYHLEHREDELVGYIKLKEFNAVAKRDLVTAMNRLTGAGAASILLDLRDNPGGLVQAGIEVAKVFLDEGNTVIYTVAKDPLVQKPVSVNSPPLTRLPVMVLVNEHTASASEIVAAALHDNCRAILVGRRTFGKGLIQSVFELSDGSGVILTVGKYVTPNHQDIDGNGISPDFRELPRLVDFKKQIEMCAP